MTMELVIFSLWAIAGFGGAHVLIRRNGRA